MPSLNLDLWGYELSFSCHSDYSGGRLPILSLSSRSRTGHNRRPLLNSNGCSNSVSVATVLGSAHLPGISIPLAVWVNDPCHAEIP